ncbi:hypothetical protein SDC9_207183 [bioreactor metagenome]|uniref:Uncharacterized protein n=1 Tax=bioreactor metagenome TaxID=1076179 RepID=A0A645J8L4_9ZZZZ
MRFECLYPLKRRIVDDAVDIVKRHTKFTVEQYLLQHIDLMFAVDSIARFVYAQRL